MPITIMLESPYFLDAGQAWEGEDLCAHGTTVIEADGREIIRYTGTVSAAALMLLRSTLRDHKIPWRDDEEHMLPCCGHCMIPSEDGAHVTILGCANGVDFDLTHKDGSVCLAVEEQEPICLSEKMWRDAVCAYAAQVAEFYRTSPERKIVGEFAQGGYVAFWREFHSLMPN